MQVYIGRKVRRTDGFIVHFNGEDIFPGNQEIQVSLLQVKTHGIQPTEPQGFMKAFCLLIPGGSTSLRPHMIPGQFSAIEVGHESIIEIHIKDKLRHHRRIGECKPVPAVDRKGRINDCGIIIVFISHPTWPGSMRQPPGQKAPGSGIRCLVSPGIPSDRSPHPAN